MNLAMCHYRIVNILKVVGQNIRRLRESQGYSQETLAAKAGLRRSYIGNLESGNRNLTVISLNQIALALNVHPIVLLIPESLKYD
jgi:transcriptional regulator with XRE-family HTH domain